MKIKLDKNLRKYVELEIEEVGKLKYYERNTAQVEEVQALAKEENTKIVQFNELNKKHFLENLVGSEVVKDKLLEFYAEDGNIYELMQELDAELGKLKKRG